MAKHNDVGKQGEALAEQFLVDHGYQTVFRNWRCPKGEIDLIVKNCQSIVFVEVKTRSTDFWGNPEIAVSDNKIKRIVDAAEYFLFEYDFDLDIRFDIISIVINKNTSQIYHIADAFVAPIN